MKITVLAGSPHVNGTSNTLVNEFKRGAEEGNLKYEYFFPMDDFETVMLIDRWKDEKSLDFHHKSPMMEEIARLREKYKLSMKVEKYTEVK